MIGNPHILTLAYHPGRVVQIASTMERSEPTCNVIPIISAEEGQVHYRNVFMDGFQSLEAFVVDQHQITASNCLHIIHSVLRGLTAMGEASHGNLTMANVFVNPKRAIARVIIGPFGDSSSLTADLRDLGYLAMELSTRCEDTSVLDELIDAILDEIHPATVSQLMGLPCFAVAYTDALTPKHSATDLDAVLAKLNVLVKPRTNTRRASTGQAGASSRALHRRQTLSSAKELAINHPDELDTDDDSSVTSERRSRLLPKFTFIKSTFRYMFSRIF